MRLVRQRPGSAEALLHSIRWRSDHSDTVSKGSGVNPYRPGKEGNHIATGRATRAMATEEDARLWITLDGTVVWED